MATLDKAETPCHWRQLHTTAQELNFIYSLILRRTKRVVFKRLAPFRYKGILNFNIKLSNKNIKISEKQYYNITNISKVLFAR